MSSSLYAGQLLLLPILAATSYCSTAAACWPVNLRRNPLRLSKLCLQPCQHSSNLLTIASTNKYSRCYCQLQ